MRKKNLFSICGTCLIALGMLIQGTTTYAADTSVSLSGGDSEALKTILEDDGFTVQQGTFYELDTIQMASEGKLFSCFGNNAGSSYMVFDLPTAPNQEVPNPVFPPGSWQYKLSADEAIVLVTPLPSECAYYSFINYIMFTEQKAGKDYSNEKGFFSAGDETTGLYHPIFGSIGEPVNMQNIKHSGDSAFGTSAVMVISANQTVTEQIEAALAESGFSEDMINVMPIPENTYHMGLEKGVDTFCFLGRISQPTDSNAYEAYVSSLSEQSVVYRITPQNEIKSNAYENAVVTARGTGVHEISAVPNAPEHLDEIRNAIIAKYEADYDYEELRSEIAVPEGLTAYFNDTNAQGDNRDTTYFMTQDFTLNSDEDFIVVYGVNHTKTKKAVYSNAVLYARPMLNGICSVYDSLFEGSATEYLEDGCENADQYYVYKMARTQMDEHTAIIEYSTGNEKGKYYGVDNGNPLLLAFRAYLDETGVGGSYYELIYDHAIIFHKK